jgi:hypothetical protein
MSERDDINYYVRRAQQERKMMGQAPDGAIASSHRKLAEEYERLVQSGSTSQRPAG